MHFESGYLGSQSLGEGAAEQQSDRMPTTETGMREIDIVVIALVVVLVHLASPQLAGLIRNKGKYSSFSGGLAVAYVFLHLLTELDVGHELIGSRIYFVALIGFTFLYGFEFWLLRQKDSTKHRAHYALQMGIAMVYSALLVFTLGTQLPATLLLTVVFVIAIGMDLLSDDIDFLEEFDTRFRNQGRYLVAGAGAAGFALSLVRRPHEVYIDLLTAVLAGFMLYSVFRDEVPTASKAHFTPFLAGLGTFLVIHFLLGG